ncbi:hypothetical protein BST96_11795 [Oceanicoccus sagamiensis]|uniref:Uncharacterized protein n=2 Tax=Oceanicoccus sagamiensis TaxID=716816 RepID=A0A1X9NKQ7_9GAMM|nr:hypothetical protein BST96_11795 [Oceanicoccus sagamiensis]
MAGTSAVFVFADNAISSPVERDGMVWTGEELHLNELAQEFCKKPAMANALSLEGLEDYDPPEDGDLREVQSFGCHFVYLQRTHCWIQVAPPSE